MAKPYLERQIRRLLPAVVLLSALAAAQDQKPGREGDWFYLVKTEPSSPSREAEFNAWYDDIDIPDVLAVPSFRRAQRAVGLEIPSFPQVSLKEGDGKYAALYDIASGDIDNAIIDLYVAARKMNALGRSTDALRVVEANYYQRLSVHDLRAPTSGGNVFFFVQKIVCCRTEEGIDRIHDWFDKQNAPELIGTGSVIRASLYQLYRIMEELAVTEDEIPHLLAIYAVESGSAQDALSGLNSALGDFQSAGPAGNRQEVRDSILYRRINDVRSN